MPLYSSNGNVCKDETPCKTIKAIELIVPLALKSQKNKLISFTEFDVVGLGFH